MICPIFNICWVRRVALRALWWGKGGKHLRNLRFFKGLWGVRRVGSEHSEQSESAVGGECGRDVSRPYKLWGLGEQNKFYECDVAGNEKGEEILAADS